MWKPILLCLSLFGVAAVALGHGSRAFEPAAMPTAIALCLIGIVLILSAPSRTLDRALAERQAKAPEPAPQRASIERVL